MSDSNDQTTADQSGANVPLQNVLGVSSVTVAQNPDGSITVSTGIGTGSPNPNLGASPQVFTISAADQTVAQAGGDNGCVILILTRYNNLIGL